MSNCRKSTERQIAPDLPLKTYDFKEIACGKQPWF
jgi:hypothetical protein